jgi:hypothetical protein
MHQFDRLPSLCSYQLQRSVRILLRPTNIDIPCVSYESLERKTVLTKYTGIGMRASYYEESKWEA